MLNQFLFQILFGNPATAFRSDVRSFDHKGMDRFLRRCRYQLFSHTRLATVESKVPRIENSFSFRFD